MIFKPGKIQDLQNKLNILKDSYHGQLVSNYLKRKELPKVFGDDSFFNVLAATSSTKIPKNYYELRTEYLRDLKERIPALNLIGTLPEEVRKNLYNRISPILKTISPQFDKAIKKELFMLESTVEKIWRRTKSVFKWLIDFSKSIFEHVKELFSEVNNALFNYSPMRLLEIIDPIFFAPFFRPIFNKVKEIIKGIVTKVILNPIKNYTLKFFRRLFTKEEKPLIKDPEVMKLLKGLTLAENISKFFGLKGTKLGAGLALGVVGFSIAKNSPFVKTIETVVKNVLEKLGLKKESVKKIKDESKRIKQQLKVKFKSLQKIATKKVQKTGKKITKRIVRPRTKTLTNKHFWKLILAGSILTGIYKFVSNFKKLKDKVFSYVPSWATDFLDHPLESLKKVWEKVKYLFDKYVISPIKIAFSKLKEFLQKIGFDFGKEIKPVTDQDVSETKQSHVDKVGINESIVGKIGAKLDSRQSIENMSKIKISEEQKIKLEPVKERESKPVIKKVETKTPEIAETGKQEIKKVEQAVKTKLINSDSETVEKSSKPKTQTNIDKFEVTPTQISTNRNIKEIKTFDTNDLYQIVTTSFVDSNIIAPDWLTLLR